MIPRISAIQLQHKKHSNCKQLVQYFADKDGWAVHHTRTQKDFKSYKYKKRDNMLKKVNELVGAATLSDYIITRRF